MIGGLLSTLLAHAQSPCPEPRPLLGSAENDALNYYLADAKAGLVKVVDAWGCGARATPADQGMYFRVRGLLAYLDADEALAKRAFAAAKDHGTSFASDYGTEVQALWDAAALPEGDATELAVKGREEGEWLAIDGVDADPVVPQGYHLLQVGTEATARGARIIDATGGELTVAFTAAPRPAVPVVVAPPAAPAPSASPDLLPTDGVAAVDAVPAESIDTAPTGEADRPPAEETVTDAEGTDETPTADREPPSGGAMKGPFVRKKGPQYLDEGGSQVHWRSDLLPMAGQDAYGARARRQFLSNPVAQGVALTVTPAAAYGAYIFGWDATVGHNLDSGVSWGATAGFAAVGVTAAIWEAVLLTKRPKRRVEIEQAAGRVADGAAVDD